MQRSERGTEALGDGVIFNESGLTVRHMTIGTDWKKLEALWARLQTFRTLFSDITRGDFQNFVAQATSADSLWLEILKGNEVVGLFSIEGLHKIVDVEAHILFFDRDTSSAGRVQLCKRLMEWLFDRLPIQRVSVHVPTIYYATVRLAKNVGFKTEGKKRQAVLIGGRWNDILLLGLTRAEAVKIWDS